MSDFSKFRTAVSGFNRTDVVNYIESTSIEHQKALRKLTDERDKLAAENARLQVELAGLQKRLEQAQADNDALSGQVNALAQEGSDLAEQLKKSEEAPAGTAGAPCAAAGRTGRACAAAGGAGRIRRTGGGAGAVAHRKGADRLPTRRADRAQCRRARPAHLRAAVHYCQQQINGYKLVNLCKFLNKNIVTIINICRNNRILSKIIHKTPILIYILII